MGPCKSKGFTFRKQKLNDAVNLVLSGYVKMRQCLFSSMRGRDDNARARLIIALDNYTI